MIKQITFILFFILTVFWLKAQPHHWISPQHGAVLSDTTVTLRWNRHPGSNVLYEVQVATDSLCTNLVTGFNGLVEPQFSAGLSWGGIYWWRVRVHLAGNPQGWTTTSKFTLFIPSLLSSVMGWFEPDSGLTTNGLQVPGWQSRTGTYALTQTNPSNMPMLTDTLLFQRPGVLFDGTNDYLEGPFLNKQAFTFIAFHHPLNKNSSIFSQARFTFSGFNWQINNTQRPSINCLMTPANTSYTFSSYPYPFPIPSARASIDGLLFNSSSIIMRTNLADTSSAQTISFLDSPSLTYSRMGAMGNNSSWYKGQIYELIVADTILPLSDYMLIYQYLAWKYQPPVSLGPDKHLVYSFCPLQITPDHHYKSYIWSTGDTTQTIAVSIPGTYWLQVTDYLGRISADTILVTGQIPSSALMDTIICLYDSVVLDPGITGAYTYTWNNNPSLNQPALITSTGGYHVVEITDTLNCSIRDSVMVSIDTYVLNVSLGPDKSVCSGEVLGLVSGTAQTVSYQWSTGPYDTLPQILLQTTGMFSVTTTNAHGCQAVDQVNVHVKGVSPLVNFQISSGTLCLKDTLSLTDLTVPVIPNDPLASWVWSLGDGDSAFTPGVQHLYPAPGSYTISLLVTTDSGCFGQAWDTVTILPLPQAGIASGQACSGVPVSLTYSPSGPPPISFLWHFYTGTTLSGNSISPSPTFTWNTPGSNKVIQQVTDTNGCKNSDSLMVNVHQSPVAAFSYMPPTVCRFDSMQFTDNSIGHPSSPITSRIWYFGDGSTQDTGTTQPHHVYQQAGQFAAKLVVTCGSTGCSDSITSVITVGELPVAHITGPTFCSGQTKNLEEASYVPGDSITSWIWQSNAFGTLTGKNPAVTFPNPGSYAVTLTVMSSFGCIDSAQSVVTVNPTPDANFRMFPIYGFPPLQVTFSNLTTDADYYVWDFGDSTYSTLMSPAHSFNLPGIFMVTLTASTAQGCQNEYSDQVYTIKPLLDIELTKLDALLEGYRLKIAVEYKNNSQVEVHQVDFMAWLNGENPVLESWIANESSERLLAGNLGRYEFVSRLLIQEGLENPMNIVCVKAIIPEYPVDDNPGNDQQCIPFMEHFAINNPFPNPTGDAVNLDVIIENPDYLTIQLHDIHGRHINTLFSGFLAKGLNRIHIPLLSEHTPQGIYFLKIQYRDQIINKKIILINLP